MARLFFPRVQSSFFLLRVARKVGMRRCSPERDHLMSQVQCWYPSHGTVLVDCYLSHRPNGGRGVGIMGGCEDT